MNAENTTVAPPSPVMDSNIMPYFIGTKVVQAEPQLNLQAGDNVSTAGYRVVYPDGYESWSPKDVFEKAYMPLGPDNRNQITELMVNDFMVKRDVTKMGEKTTVVMVTLANGFVIVEGSSCVDPANYSEELGVNICMGRIKDKIWEMLGFLLQTAKGGVN